MRASVSGCPDVSPTRPTRSPTTIGVRPSSRARMATTGVAGGVAVQRAGPAAAVDRDDHGRLRVGVLRPALAARPGALARAAPARRTRRTRRDSPRAPAARARPPRQRGPEAREVGDGLGGARRCRRSHARHDQPDERARGGHPVVGVGPPRRSPAQRGRPDRPGRRRSRSTSPPSAVISVASAARRSVSWPRRCATPRSGDGPAASAARAATVGVSSLTSCRSTSTPARVSGPRHRHTGRTGHDRGAELLEHRQDPDARLGRVARANRRP